MVQFSQYRRFHLIIHELNCCFITLLQKNFVMYSQFSYISHSFVCLIKLSPIIIADLTFSLWFFVLFFCRFQYHLQLFSDPDFGAMHVNLLLMIDILTKHNSITNCVTVKLQKAQKYQPLQYPPKETQGKIDKMNNSAFQEKKLNPLQN